MTAPISFNGDPELVDRPLTFDVAIGFAHHVEVGDDGTETLVYERDEDDKFIPTVYRLPSRVTVQQVRTAAKRFKAELRETGQEVLPGWDIFIVLLDSVVGDGFISKVGDDKTVTTPAFMGLVMDLTDRYGLAAMLGHLGIAELGEDLPKGVDESS